MSGKVAGGLGISVLLAGGCANPAPPKPPTLHLAKPVKDLSGVRTGDEVQLRWTTSEETTDGVEIRGHLTAEICEMEVVPGGVCGAVKRVDVLPGHSKVDLALAGADVGGPLRELGFRLRLLNGGGRSAGESNQVILAGGRGPAAVQGLSVRATKEGALVMWQAIAGTGVVELSRQRLEPRKAMAESGKKGGSGVEGANAELSANAELVEMHLQAGVTDAGGTLDRSAKMGETYSYVAQRVQRLKMGGQDLEARSAESAPVQVRMQDVFPPAVPQGLVAVRDEADQPGIDLSWEPVTDADLAGYLVYRQAVGADGMLQGTVRRVTETPVQVPGYRDETAVAGQRYAYRVSAVDAAGNESAQSGSALEEDQP